MNTKQKQLNPLKYDRVACLKYIIAHIQSGRKNCILDKVVLHARCGGILNNLNNFTANSLKNEAVLKVGYNLF